MIVACRCQTGFNSTEANHELAAFAAAFTLAVAAQAFAWCQSGPSVYHEGSVCYVRHSTFGARTEERSLQTMDLVLQTVRAATYRENLPEALTIGIIKQ